MIDTYQSGFINLSKNYHNVYDIFLIDTQGNILFTVEPEAGFGTNLFTGKYYETQFSIASKKNFHLRTINHLN
ncbi:MAG: hypothetical protein ACI8O8_002068 [Oleiphilaceae bacterium]|jgi:hypothetical protein